MCSADAHTRPPFRDVKSVRESSSERRGEGGDVNDSEWGPYLSNNVRVNSVGEFTNEFTNKTILMCTTSIGTPFSSMQGYFYNQIPQISVVKITPR